MGYYSAPAFTFFLSFIIKYISQKNPQFIGRNVCPPSEIALK